MPDIKMARFGSKPIKKGASTVAPNMAMRVVSPIQRFVQAVDTRWYLQDVHQCCLHKGAIWETNWT